MLEFAKLTTNGFMNVTLSNEKTECMDFEALYDTHYDRIFSYIMRSVMNRSLAEDLTSGTFLKAYKNFPRFNPQRGKFSSWLYRIASNSIRDHFRKSSKASPVDPHDDLITLLVDENAPNGGEQMELLSGRE